MPRAPRLSYAMLPPPFPLPSILINPPRSVIDHYVPGIKPMTTLTSPFVYTGDYDETSLHLRSSDRSSFSTTAAAPVQSQSARAQPPFNTAPERFTTFEVAPPSYLPCRPGRIWTAPVPVPVPLPMPAPPRAPT